MNSILKTINWPTIQKVWTDNLWPGRESPIKPTNGLLLGGGWSKELESETPTFFGVYDGNILCGVNSGHKAETINDKKYYRSRGIYVYPEYRGKGIAQMLLKATEEQAIKENCDILWSMPRESSLKTYLRFGFEMYSNKEAIGMEFGPNYYVFKKIKVINDV